MVEAEFPLDGDLRVFGGPGLLFMRAARILVRAIRERPAMTSVAHLGHGVSGVDSAMATETAVA